ncbi:MAG: hypothetical protein ACLS9K_12880 [Lachnospira eligens]
MNRLTNAAKYAAIIMSLIVTVTMVSGCKKNNTDVSSELNKSDIEETSQDMTGSGIEDSDAGSQSAEETAETESTEQAEAILKGIQNRLKQMQGRRRRRIHI